MRIRWTTRIMMAIGVLTLIAGVAANGGQANAASGRPASASVERLLLLSGTTGRHGERLDYVTVTTMITLMREIPVRATVFAGDRCREPD